MQEVVESVVKLDEINEKQLTVFGGSHGGFLTAHLIGQYPVRTYKLVKINRDSIYTLKAPLGLMNASFSNYCLSVCHSFIHKLIFLLYLILAHLC